MMRKGERWMSTMLTGAISDPAALRTYEARRRASALPPAVRNLKRETRRAPGIEPQPHCFAGPESDVLLGCDRDGRARPWVAAEARHNLPRGEAAEIAQLDAVATRQRVDHGVQDRDDDLLNLLRVEVGVLGSDARDELGSDHRLDGRLSVVSSALQEPTRVP